MQYAASQSGDRKDQLFAFPFAFEMRYQYFKEGNAMPQPKKQSWAKLRSHSVRAADIDKLLNALRALDRTVVEFSMEIYKVPRRDRAGMLEQHRLLHDMVRERIASISVPE